MIETAPRLFADDAAIRKIGRGLLDHSLPRVDWTHEAHLAAATWLVRERPDIDIDGEIATIIRSYNIAAGGVNDDTQGYHDTITRACLAGVRAHMALIPADATLVVAVNSLLAAPAGRRDWPLGFYSRDRLMSVTARQAFVEPDIAPLPA